MKEQLLNVGSSRFSVCKVNIEQVCITFLTNVYTAGLLKLCIFFLLLHLAFQLTKSNTLVQLLLPQLSVNHICHLPKIAGAAERLAGRYPIISISVLWGNSSSKMLANVLA